MFKIRFLGRSPVLLVLFLVLQRTAIFVSVSMRFILKNEIKFVIAHLLSAMYLGRSPAGRAIRCNALPLWAKHFHCYP
jgi:hypothetical protein